MDELGPAIGWGVLVGGSLLVGAVVAAVVELPERVSATLTAFGGGVLFAAVALELVPDADGEAGAGLTALGLVAGMAVYVGADAWLNRDAETKRMRRAGHAAAAGRPMTDTDGNADLGDAGGGSATEAARGESIAVGLFVDGVPESIALGLTIAEGKIGLALLVGVVVGNVVEAYGAAQPMITGGRTKAFAIRLLGGIGGGLALATVLGATVLAEASPELVGTAQATAAGAVLAVVSVAIIPHAFKQVSSLAAVAIVAGFVGGYLLS